jgi:hypothetical protein
MKRIVSALLLFSGFSLAQNTPPSGGGGGTPAGPTGAIQTNGGGGTFGSITPGPGIATAIALAPDASTGLAAAPGQATVTPSAGVATFGSAAGINLFNIAALTASVTSTVAPTGQSTAKPYIFHVPVTSGTPSFAWGTGFVGFPQICPDSSSSTNILAWFDGTNNQYLNASNTTGHGCVVEGSAPGSNPPSGMGFPFYSSADHNYEYMNNAGGTMKMVLSGADINPVTGIVSKINGQSISLANSLTTTGNFAMNLTCGAACTPTIPSGTTKLTQTVDYGTAALPASAVASQACNSELTLTDTGGTIANVATTDNVMVDFNGDPTASTGFVPLTTGMLTIIKYPKSGGVGIKVCNNTGGSITPTALTLNYRVTR